MRDELTIARDLGANEELPADLARRLRRDFCERTVSPARSRRRWPARAALAGVVALVVAVAGALTGGGGGPSVAARAYAAITPPTGIMHFVVDDEVSAYDYPPIRYKEYWIDLGQPREKRVVESNAGRVVDQIAFVTRSVPGGSKPWQGHPQTSIVEAPADPATLYPGRDIRSGRDPMALYREALQSGSVVSEKATTYGGREAYTLVVKHKPPYDLVDDIWTDDGLQTFIVDRHTYFPLQMRIDPGRYGASYAFMSFPVFEILPDSVENSALLEPARNPKPYRP